MLASFQIVLCIIRPQQNNRVLELTPHPSTAIPPEIPVPSIAIHANPCFGILLTLFTSFYAAFYLDICQSFGEWWRNRSSYTTFSCSGKLRHTTKLDLGSFCYTSWENKAQRHWVTYLASFRRSVELPDRKESIDLSLSSIIHSSLQ